MSIALKIEAYTSIRIITPRIYKSLHERVIYENGTAGERIGIEFPTG
jgi:hypothetical protein